MVVLRTFCVLCVALGCFLMNAWPLSSLGVEASHQRGCADAAIRLEGAGTTTIYPLLSALIELYDHEHPDTCISYRAVGSRAGVRMLSNRTAIFAVTDLALTDEQLDSLKSSIIQIPIAINAVVIIYNLPQAPSIRLSSSAIASIFLGKITKWSDPAIVKDNPDIKLPELDIRVFQDFPDGSHDGNLNTTIISDYLANSSPSFRDELDRRAKNWPLARIPYKGATGALGFVHSTPGAIGYTWWPGPHFREPIAVIGNNEGRYVTVSPQSVTSAGASAIAAVQSHPTDYRVSLTNTLGDSSYPIASFAWVAFYRGSEYKEENRVVLDFVKWLLADGQELMRAQEYPVLPADLSRMELQYLNRMVSPESKARTARESEHTDTK